MPTTVLYRKSSGEVRKISLKGQPFDDADPAFWGVLTDPNFPDGTEDRDPDGNFRVLGYAKIWDDPDVRNATQDEINTFAAFQADDENQQAAGRAAEFLSLHPQWRKLLIAFADILVSEFNILRQWEMEFKNEVAAATSLANLQSRVATLPDLPDRTLAQLKTAILNRISKDD